MISPFSRMMDLAVECHFKKDRSGRLVFIPFTLKGKCYFVDSKSDEEKIKAFVKMFRSAVQLITWLSLPAIYVPALILDGYAGMSPRGHRMAIAFGVPLFFWLILGTLAWALWGVYKKTVPSLTDSLSEVGPDVKSHLREISRQPRRLALVFLGAGILLLGVAVLGAWYFSLNKSVHPAKIPSASDRSLISPIH